MSGASLLSPQPPSSPGVSFAGTECEGGGGAGGGG